MSRYSPVALSLLVLVGACTAALSATTTTTVTSQAVTTTSDAPAATTTGSTSTTMAATTTTRSMLLTCSSVGLSAGAAVQPGLPDAVAQMRQAIAEAAVDCDLERLVALALDGPEDFFYAIGYIGDARDFWYQAEVEGREPMRLLVCLLNLPFALTPVLEDGATLYRWPTASEVPWAELTESERDALRVCIGDDLYYWAELHSQYLGPRLAISDSGDWLFFVLGGD